MLSLSIYKLIVPIFSLFVIIGAWVRMRRGGPIYKFILWFVFWGSIAVIAAYPDLTTYMTQITGIKSNINAIVFSALLIIFYLIFHIITRLDQIESEITRIVRQEAFDHSKGKNKKKDK